MATVVLKNNTGSSLPIDDLGITLNVSEVYDATNYFEFVDLTESDDLRGLVSSGDITINDGDNDLGIEKGLEHLEIESVHLDIIQDDSAVETTTQAYCGVILDTTSQMSTSYTSISFESTSYSNDTNVIEWDGDDKITVKEDGDYTIDAHYFMRPNDSGMADSFYRIIKNDSVIVSREEVLNTYYTEIQHTAIGITIPLLAGDTVSAQCRAEYGDDIDITGAMFSVLKCGGIKGDTGPPGGTTVRIQKDGTLITSNTDLINFRGDGVSISQSSATSVNVDVTSNVFEPKYIQVRDTNGGQDMNTTDDTPLTWEVQDIRDTDTFDHTLGSGDVYILKDGLYEASYSVCVEGGSSRRNVLTYIVINDNNILDQTYSYSYTRNSSNPYATNNIGGVIISLSAGDYIELKGVRAGDSGSSTTIANRSWLKLKLIREV